MELGRTTVGHLPDHSTIFEAVTVVDFNDNAVLVIGNHLGVQIMHHSRPFPQILIAWIF